MLFLVGGRASVVVLAVAVIQSSKWRHRSVRRGFLVQYLKNQGKENVFEPGS